MAAGLRPLVLPTDADAELRLRELGHHATARSEAPRIRKCAFKVHDLTQDERDALASALLPLGGDFIASIGGTDAVLYIAETQLKALGALLHDVPELSETIAQLGENLTGEPVWRNASGQSLLKPGGTTFMGILNVTPDSFSDGGKYFDPILAEEQALRMVEDGADIIDVGGMSTRPGATEPDVNEELRRVLPVIGRLAQKLSVPISIDTYRGQVAEKALDAGATIVNDVSGFTFDPKLAAVCARKQAAVVLMHTTGKPDVMQEQTHYQDLVRDIRQALDDRRNVALEAGIPPDRIVLDPGFGFGKTADQNWELLRRFTELRGLGSPLLVGLSRKSMFRALVAEDASAEDRDPVSAMAAALSVQHGASILRVHNVKLTRECTAVAERLAIMPRLSA